MLKNLVIHTPTKNIEYSGSTHHEIFLVPIPGSPTTTTTTTNPIVDCLDGLEIEMLYMHNDYDISHLPEGYVLPAGVSVGTHTCNRAYFEVHGNIDATYNSTTFMATGRLNNNNGTGGEVANNADGTIYVCQDYDNSPSPLNGTYDWDTYSRYDKTTLTNSKALEIAALGTSTTSIDVALQSGYVIYSTECDSNPTPHADINWLRITNSSGDLLLNTGVEGGNISTIDVCTGSDPVALTLGTLRYYASDIPCVGTPYSTATYYGNAYDFTKTGKIYTSATWNGSSFTAASTGYYSNSSIWKYWDGTNITSNGTLSSSCTTTTTTTICVGLTDVEVYETTENEFCITTNKPGYVLRADTSSIYTATVLYSGTDCSTAASAGYYGTQPNWRYWDGTAFTSSGTCPITTTTTTVVPVEYYILYRCDTDDGTSYYAGPYTPSTFSAGQRVEGGSSIFYQITSATSTEPTGRTNISITSTGLVGCP